MKIKRAERKEWQYRVLFIANILLVIMIVFLTYMGGFFSRVLPFKCGGGIPIWITHNIWQVCPCTILLREKMLK